MNSNLLLHFLLFINGQLLYTVNSQIIETEFVSFSQVLYIHTEMILGENTKIHYMTVKQTYNYTLFCDEQLNVLLPNDTITRVKSNDKEIKVKKTTSELTFTNTETMKYYVLNIVDLKNDKEHCRESIYLPYKFDNIKYSLVHSLLRQRKISKALFGYQLDKKSKQGKMFFGGIPKPWIENKYYGKCMVEQDKNEWSCKLEQVLLIDELNSKKYVYQNKYVSYFDSGDDKVRAPISFIRFLNENYFQEYLEHGKCNIVSSYDGNYLHCPCVFFTTFPKIIFKFDTVDLVLDMKDLFEIYGEEKKGEGGLCDLLIMENEKSPNVWVFGEAFIKNYLISFDYDTAEVTFYSELSFKYEFGPYKEMRAILVINIICLAIISSYLMYIRKNKI